MLYANTNIIIGIIAKKSSVSVFLLTVTLTHLESFFKLLTFLFVIGHFHIPIYTVAKANKHFLSQARYQIHKIEKQDRKYSNCRKTIQTVALLLLSTVVSYSILSAQHRLRCHRRRGVVPRNSVAVAMATPRSRGRGNRYSPMSSSTIKHNTHIGKTHRGQTFLLSWQFLRHTSNSEREFRCEPSERENE